MADAAGSARRSRARPKEAEPGVDAAAETRHVCTVGFCPICLAVTAVQPMKPEAVEHLLNAAREFLLAMSAVLGARAEQTGGADERAPTLTRIDIE